jgi:hypothetical protein
LNAEKVAEGERKRSERPETPGKVDETGNARGKGKGMGK